MSTRTIIEINHDFAGMIEADPEQFMVALRGVSAPAVQRHERTATSIWGQRCVVWEPYRAAETKCARGIR